MPWIRTHPRNTNTPIQLLSTIHLFTTGVASLSGGTGTGPAFSRPMRAGTFQIKAVEASLAQSNQAVPPARRRDDFAVGRERHAGTDLVHGIDERLGRVGKLEAASFPSRDDIPEPDPVATDRRQYPLLLETYLIACPRCGKTRPTPRISRSRRSRRTHSREGDESDRGDRLARRGQPDWRSPDRSGQFRPTPPSWSLARWPRRWRGCRSAPRTRRPRCGRWFKG
jgi:hypothetical protein